MIRELKKQEKPCKMHWLELLNEKLLRKIRIQEVADLADVNRVTFYKHYMDSYDLYEQMEKEILADLEC